jgi:hypothetical protein
MKCRTCFVANSSSSSFVISLDDITAKQIYMIENHIDYAKMKFPREDFFTDEYDWWRISIDRKANTLTGNTFMDNFDMEEFMERVGIDMSKVDFTYD